MNMEHQINKVLSQEEIEAMTRPHKFSPETCIGCARMRAHGHWAADVTDICHVCMPPDDVDEIDEIDEHNNKIIAYQERLISLLEQSLSIRNQQIDLLKQKIVVMEEMAAQSYAESATALRQENDDPGTSAWPSLKP